MTFTLSSETLTEDAAAVFVKSSQTDSTPYVVKYQSITSDAVTGIAGVKAETKAQDGKMFNLAGQQVGKDYKGIVIQNGKKFVQK